jgi:SAM-dependent methyltransferase
MDDVARYNKERWEELARGNVLFSRPALNLNEGSARAMLDPESMMGDVPGKDVLCLASGGGQQSAAFALLGAHVTVLDFCETQLERDQEAAAHYGIEVRTVQGDMRDLSCFPDDAFDLVWHAHSLNFVPDAARVFDEVARVVRPEGLYRLHCTNPFLHGLSEETWDGTAYPLSRPYVDGAEVEYDNPFWEVCNDAGTPRRVRGPREFRHALGTIVNGLIERGFAIMGIWEDTSAADAAAEPGTWDHFVFIAPPWLTFWAVYRSRDTEGDGVQRRPARKAGH